MPGGCASALAVWLQRSTAQAATLSTASYRLPVSMRGHHNMSDMPQSSSENQPIEAVTARSDPTWDRLEDQIMWYDRKSAISGRNYRLARVVALLAAACVPFTITTHLDWVAGTLGVLIVSLEGIRELYNWEKNNTEYRRMAELLKHERYLYLAQSGPYSRDNPRGLLAERIETLLSQAAVKYPG